MSKLNVKAEQPSDLSKVLGQKGPPDQLILKTGHVKVDVEEYQDKTWVYDFRGEIRDAKESEIDEKTTFDPEIFFNIFLHFVPTTENIKGRKEGPFLSPRYFQAQHAEMSSIEKGVQNLN